LVAAVSGLVACSAAATVALTASDGHVPVGAGDASAPGPMALPAPGPTLPVPGPALPVPDEVLPVPLQPPAHRGPETRPAPTSPAHPAAGASPRTRRAPVVDVPLPARGAKDRGRRSTPAKEILDRVSAELARMETSDGPAGLLVVPVPREVDDGDGGKHEEKKHGGEKKHDGEKKKRDKKHHDKHRDDENKHHEKHGDDEKHHAEKHGDDEKHHDKKRQGIADRCPAERVLWKKGAHPKSDEALLITRRHKGSGFTVRHVDASCALAALGHLQDRADT
jgi:hypothetical protein